MQRLDDELAGRGNLEGACKDADARYQSVAAELARNNQEIHAWRTVSPARLAELSVLQDERLSMERGLSELRAQLESSRWAHSSS